MVGVIEYVLERRCPSGGYCFYKLDEPTTSDTFFALSTLKLLCLEASDRKSLDYLLSVQYEDGSYQSIETCFYAVKALDLMGALPRINPVNYLTTIEKEILKAIEKPFSDRYALIKHCYFISWLKSFFGHEVVKDVKRFAREMLHSPYLSERFYAVKCLISCGEDVEKEEHIRFLRKCELPHLGFSESPNTQLVYIEQQYMGTMLCRILKTSPQYPEAIEDFVKSCQRKNGGFGRCSTGIATLEYTFYGVSILKSKT